MFPSHMTLQQRAELLLSLPKDAHAPVLRSAVAAGRVEVLEACQEAGLFEVDPHEPVKADFPRFSGSALWFIDALGALLESTRDRVDQFDSYIKDEPTQYIRVTKINISESMRHIVHDICTSTMEKLRTFDGRADKDFAKTKLHTFASMAAVAASIDDVELFVRVKNAMPQALDVALLVQDVVHETSVPGTLLKPAAFALQFDSVGVLKCLQPAQDLWRDLVVHGSGRRQEGRHLAQVIEAMDYPSPDVLCALLKPVLACPETTSWTPAEHSSTPWVASVVLPRLFDGPWQYLLTSMMEHAPEVFQADAGYSCLQATRYARADLLEPLAYAMTFPPLLGRHADVPGRPHDPLFDEKHPIGQLLTWNAFHPDKQHDVDGTLLVILREMQHRGLLAELVDAPAQGPEGVALAHSCVHHGWIRSLTFLAQEGARLDARDELGRTPLDQAVQTGDKGLVDLVRSLQAQRVAHDAAAAFGVVGTLPSVG